MIFRTGGAALTMAMTVAVSAAAAISPVGYEGQNWARTTFSIRNGVSVLVTARNRTVNPLRGNTSTIVIYVNGQAVANSTRDRAESQLTYVVSGDGAYEVMAICTNHLADADTCSVTATKVPPTPTFE